MAHDLSAAGVSAVLAACAAQVRQASVAVPGVKDDSVHYPEGHAVITMDATSRPAHEHLRKAVERWATG